MKINSGALLAISCIGLLVLGSHCSNNGTSKELWAEALQADATENFNESIPLYTTIIERNFNDTSTTAAYTNRGRAKISAGDTIGGLADLNKAVSILPSYQTLLSIALIKTRINPSEALSYLHQAKTLAPQQPVVYTSLLGYFTMVVPNRDSATFYADNILKYFEPDGPTMDLLMSTYMTFLNPDKLIMVTDRILLNNTNHAYAYNNRGYAYLVKGEYDLAGRDIRSSLRIDASNSFAYKNLGLYFLKTNKKDSACVHFRKALDLNFTAQYGLEVDSLVRTYCVSR